MQPNTTRTFLLLALLQCSASAQQANEPWVPEPPRPTELPFPIPIAVQREADAIQRAAEAGKVFEAKVGRVPDFAASISAVRRKVKDVEDIRRFPGLALLPMSVPLGATPGLALLGGFPAGTKTPSGWTGLTRLFQHPKLGYVILEEYDLGKSGGWVKFAYFNCSVTGQPGVFVRMSSTDGNTQTTLSWQHNQVLFKLTLKPVDDSVRQSLIAFAETFGS